LYLTAANEDGTLRLWSMANSTDSNAKWTSKTEGALLCIAYSGDGKTIVTGGDNGGMKIWSAREGKMLASWPGAAEKTAITDIAAERGGHIFSTSADGKIAGWQLKN
jgi:WD40 repeat protein